MTYYFVSFDSGLAEQFQKRFSFLGKATFITNKDQLAQIVSKDLGPAIFLVYFKDSKAERDDFVLTVREKCPKGKIVYVAEGKTGSELKSHQLTPVGGDAYVDIKVNEEVMLQVVDGMKGSEEVVEKDDRGLTDQSILTALKNDPKSLSMDATFSSVIKLPEKKALYQSAETLTSALVPEKQTQVEEQEIEDFEELESAGEDMSDKDKDLSLDDLGDLELGGDDAPPPSETPDDGMDLSLDPIEMDLSDDSSFPESLPDESDSLEMDDSENVGLDQDENIENMGELDFGEDPDTNLSLSKIAVNVGDSTELKLSDSTNISAVPDLSLDEDFALDFGDSEVSDQGDLSEEAKEKLKEIDEIMVKDATQNSITIHDIEAGSDMIMDASLDEPLVSDDLNLDSLNFGGMEEDEPTRVKTIKVVEDEATRVKTLKDMKADEDGEEEEEEVVEKPKRKKKESKDRDLGADLKEISGAYTGEMERNHATIHNLRADRDELLAKIQKLEDDRILHNRQALSTRAELDEKKIELTIIRKKLNQEINELKDRLNVFDEKRLILEEKNKYLTVELDKAGQKNKIDVKKVQMRERELEQKLELLKSDAENQIRNRDLKILELKRKIDAMEFDMESISQQEKRSVESRFELEDKLGKAIKTLRGAITVLEDESQRGNALEALKKNIDM